MKQKKVSFVYKKRRVNLKAFECFGAERIRGLMFRRRKNALALIFDFKNQSREPIHSVFVFFPFIAVWLDGKKVVDVKIVRPFLPFIRPKKSFDKLIEVPLNDKYKEELKNIVGKERFKN